MEGFGWCLGRIKFWASKIAVQWLLAILFFFFTSWLYMGAGISNCSVSTTALGSDSTGGLAWFQWASGNHLTWGYTTKSNYPVGESINRPQFITSEAFDIPYRIFSTLSTPICGLNMMILLGYVSCGLAMFGFIKWLTRRYLLGLFAGYAAAFVPFHQLKSGSHVVYMFGSIFIGITWAFLWYVQKPNYRRISLFAALTALGFYIDGYFVLFSALLAAGLVISNLIYLLVSRSITRKKAWSIFRVAVKRYFYYGLLVVILVLPIIFTQLKHGNDISQSLSSSRGNIKAEAITYGARPEEFVLPAFNNPIMPSNYANWRLDEKQTHFSNASEDTLYIGATILILFLLSLIAFGRPKLRQLNFAMGLSYQHIFVVLFLSALGGFLFAMPSHSYLFGHHLVFMPSDLIIKLTKNWRVFSRLFLVIDPLIITLAVCGLYLLVRNLRYRWYLLIMVICFVGIFLDYLASPLHPSGNINANSPAIYQKIKRDKSVHVMAEYPLASLLIGPSVFTFQEVHGKNLLNANSLAINEDPFHQGIGGLSDTQTAGVLKARGIDLVTSYGAPDSSGNYASYAPPDTGHRAGTPTIYSYRIRRGVETRPITLVTKQGFDSFSVDDKEISHRVITKNGVMAIVPSGQNHVRPARCGISFQANPLVGPAKIMIMQNGQKIYEGDLATRIQVINVTGSCEGDWDLILSAPVDITDMSAQYSNV